MSTLQIGVSPLSWTNEVLLHLGDGITAEECLSQASRAGYSGIEMGRKLPATGAELSRLLEQYGLALISGWYNGFLAERSLKEEIKAVRALAELLRDLDCEVLIYGECGKTVADPPFNARLSGRLKLESADLPAYVSRLNEFARFLVNEYGLKLAYHHHLMMVIETFDEIISLFDLAEPEVGLLLDTGHAFAAGFDYRHLLNQLGDRICHIHLKDVRRSVLNSVRSRDESFNQAVLRGMFTVPGDGDIDFRPIADFVQSGGYEGWIVVEAEQDPELAPPFATVSRAREYIGTLLG